MRGWIKSTPLYYKLYSVTKSVTVMYDNLDFKLRKSDGMNVDFLGETPCYFNRVELEQWLQRNRIATSEEIEQKAQNYCMKKGGTL